MAKEEEKYVPSKGWYVYSGKEDGEDF